MQIFTVLTDILKYHSYTYGLLIGGANRSVEVKNLAKGTVFKGKSTFASIFYHLKESTYLLQHLEDY